MKKIILGGLALTLTVTLAACGTSANNATITSLSNQLDDTANAISNIQTINPTDLSMSKSVLENISTKNTSSLSSNLSNTQQTLLDEEYYKIDILNKTAKVKNCLSQDIKLSKTQINAVKDLTKSLAKYTNSIEYSESEMTSTIKHINSLKKNATKHAENINAKLNRLACNSNSRSSYYENLINTLSQLEECLNVDECINNTPQETENSTEPLTKTKAETKTNNKGLLKNIDTYLPEQTTNDGENCPNCDQNQADIDNTTNTHQSAENNQINRYSRYNRFNSTRNIDTYGPTARNIDTYGYNGMNGYGYNNAYGNTYGNAYRYGPYAYNPQINGGFNGVYNSNNFNRMTTPIAPNTTYVNAEKQNVEQRLEDFEEIDNDNTVKKVEQKTEDIAETSTQTTESPTEEVATTSATTQANEEKNHFKTAKKRIVDVRENNTENADDLNAPTIAY